jgi:hypothetical protein
MKNTYSRQGPIGGVHTLTQSAEHVMHQTVWCHHPQRKPACTESQCNLACASAGGSTSAVKQ